jgi:hypothetical protein
MEHPTPHAITTPHILGLHPMKTLHPGISPYHMYPLEAPHMANTQVAPLARLVLLTHRRSCSVDSTLTTHPRLMPRSPQVHYQVIIRFTAPRALTHTPLTHQHHITDIMQVRVKQ